MNKYKGMVLFFMKKVQKNILDLKQIYYPEIYIPTNKVNKKNEYDLSILIPVYNAEEFLTRTLNSIVGQKTKYNYEIVIVNDGSSDGSSDILNKFKEKNNNIKIINQSNHGISYARNVLLENASGKYISFVDSDDTISEYFVEKMLNIIKSQNVGYVKCNYKKIQNKTSKCIFESNYKSDTNKENIDKYLWGSIIEKKEYENVSFPENYWFEDMVFNFFIVSRMKKIVICEDYLYNYYEYENSASKIQGKKSNVKNLDQFYLVYNIVNFYFCNKMKFTEEQEKIILHELGTMLVTRTLELKYKERKKVFYASCELIDKIDFSQKYKELLIFKKRKFLNWNIAAIYNRICQKRRLNK